MRADQILVNHIVEVFHHFVPGDQFLLNLAISLLKG